LVQEKFHQSGCRNFSSSTVQQAAATPAAAAADQESLEHIRARIFGNHIGGQGFPQTLLLNRKQECCGCGSCSAALTAALFPSAGNGLRSGRKVLRRALAGKKLLEWYPPDPIKADPLMLDLKAEKWVALGWRCQGMSLALYVRRRWSGSAVVVSCQLMGRAGLETFTLTVGVQPIPVCNVSNTTPQPPFIHSAKLKLDRLRRRGKAPPKKGAGKRAGKKK
jgi:hypothetical protein